MEDRIATLRERVAGMSPAQREALRAKVEAAGIDWARVVPAAAPAPRPARVPLSPAQMHFWLLQQVHSQSAAFSIAFAWEIEGPLDRVALQRALDVLMVRHEPLRTAVPSEDGQPWQEILAAPAVPLDEIDLSRDPSRAEAAERAFAARPFDLAEAPLFRVQLQRLAPDRHRMLVAFHHIVVDGWSRGVFLRELAEGYRAARAGGVPALPDLPRQFADLVLHQADWLDGPAARDQEAFWRAELEDLTPQQLPTRCASADRSAATSVHRIDPALAARVAPAAASLGVSPFMLLLATFQLLLHRMTGSDDIAVGTPTAGRTAPGSAGLVGLFVNTLVLRSRPRAGLSFRAWLDHVRAGFARALDHQDLPFARVVEAVGAERRAGQNPLFQTLFQVQTGGYGHQNAEYVDLGDPRLTVRQRVIPLDEAKFDLSWHMMEGEDGLSVLVEYRFALFGRAWIARMVAQFEMLLSAAIETPNAAIETLDFVPSGEVAVLHGPDRDIPDLTAMLAAQAGRGETALICESTGESWTGAELDAAATRMARQLRAQPDLAGADPRLAICLPRGSGLVIALLAALKAGIPYVPLDPAHPAERRDAILRDAEAGLMLATGAPTAPCPVLDPATLGEEAPEAELPDSDPERLAYLVFTSGSTGRPKGVPITHRALSNLIAAMAERPGLRRGDRMLALTTVAFDIAALELLLPLATGAKLVLADGDLAVVPDRFATALERHAITHVQATPATWRLLIETGWTGRAGLTALCGGEALPSDLGRALLRRSAALWNMYGPTETTIWSAALRVTEAHLQGPHACLGDPVANTSLRVLDPYGTSMPPGLPGELAIGGAGLSPGYWRRPDLTDATFVEVPGERLYRTGDRAVIEDDGTVSFLGRLDAQIKLNGHRIEPGEVEAALATLPEVAEALVVADSGRLVAYCRPAADAPEPARLRDALASRLPAYMIPAVFVMLDAVPLNANGKVDRARLPAPDGAGASEGRAAETEAERVIQTLWAEVLGRDAVGLDDNFFELGGASVSAMQIASRARARGLSLTPAQMFEYQTVAAQAAAVQPLAEAERLPLSPWQQALLEDPGPPPHVRLTVAPGREAGLADAVAAMTAAHPVLRFTLDADGWRTETAAPPDVSRDCSGWSDAVLPEDGPLWGARLSKGSLEVAAHPLLLDPASLGRLAGEILAHLDGAGAPVPDDAYQRWLRAKPTASAPEAVPFQGDGPDNDATPVVQSLDAVRQRGLRDGAQRLNLPQNRIATAALFRSLAQWSGADATSIALIEAAPVEALGHVLRLVPITLRDVPAEPAASARAVEAAVAAGDPRGVDPRTLPPGMAVFSWQTRPTGGGTWLREPELALPQSPALHLAAVQGPESLELSWRFDPARVRRATVERLAARHIADLAAPPVSRTGTGASGTRKLDRLRTRLTDRTG